jgi:2-dehydro-3-deoxy-D-arabinonate dehydratase
MKLYRTKQGPVVEDQNQCHLLPDTEWNALIAREDVLRHIAGRITAGNLPKAERPASPLSPVDAQEVWAAGVTYWRSREARMEESKSAGGGDFYDRVYSAERPELFSKSSGHRVVPPGGMVRIRRDSKWNVPEPELTLLISSTGKITGYTIGNDMSSRDIEGENPLYLPQAKVYDGSCAVGPCVLLSETPPPPATAIEIRIVRAGATVFSGRTDLAQIKRPLPQLAEFLYRELSFPHGCFLMTGTGIVPPDSFTLDHGDEVRISIGEIGELVNSVE